MAINAEFHTNNGILYVKATGKDDSIADVIAYGQQVVEQALAHQTNRILADETELVYAIGTLDLFTSAKVLAAHAPHVARSALVVDPNQVNDAKFFETVAINRGLSVRIFTSFEEAEAWLAIQ